MFPTALVLYQSICLVWTNCQIALASSQLKQLTALLLYQLFAQGRFYYMQIIDINWDRMDLLRGLDSSLTIWYVHFYDVMYLLLEYSFVWELCCKYRICQGWDNADLFGFSHAQPSGCLTSEHMRQLESFNVSRGIKNSYFLLGFYWT